MAAGAWLSMVTVTGADFCVRRLAVVMMAIFITMIHLNVEMDQSGKSKSMLCTMVENLDRDSTQAMVDDRTGIAELASNNFCMLPRGMSVADRKRSAVSHPIAFREPNDAKMPRCFLRCLADDFKVPCRGWNPDWMHDTACWKDVQYRTLDQQCLSLIFRTISITILAFSTMWQEMNFQVWTFPHKA